MFENLAMTRTVTEKLSAEFSRKYLKILGSKRLEMELCEWSDYLKGLNGVRYIRKFSHLAEQIDYLLEIINEGDFRDYVVRCPVRKENFIILTKEAAELTLTLGLP